MSHLEVECIDELTLRDDGLVRVVLSVPREDVASTDPALRIFMQDLCDHPLMLQRILMRFSKEFARYVPPDPLN